MADFPSYPYYPTDFDSATAHWTAEEVGAYQRLLNFQWCNGQIPTSIEELSRIARTKTPFKRVWPTLEPKFPKNNGHGLQNLRLEKVRGAMLVKSEKCRKAAETRWANATGDADALADAYANAYANGNAKPHAESMPSKSKSLSNTSSTPTESAPAPSNKQRDRVQRVLDIYPPVPPARAAKWLKDWSDDEALLEALRECQRLGYLLNPVNYVSQVLESARKNGGEVRGGVKMKQKPGASDENREQIRALD